MLTVDALAFSGGDIAEFCRQVVDIFGPSHVVYAGLADEEVVQEFQQLGTAAVRYSLDFDSIEGGSSLPEMDSATPVLPSLLILEQSVLNKSQVFPLSNLIGRFGMPDKILIVLFPARGELMLPLIAQWLRQSGYVRDFSVELWVDEKILACAFGKSSLELDLVEMYEEEWWRLAVLNRTRRRLLQNYLQELIESVFWFEHRVMELEARWEAFWHSRTGKVVQWIEKIRLWNR